MKKNPGKEYDNEFYKLMTNQNFEANNLTSAQEMVPYILKLFPNAASVIDVGCGIGIWASTFKNNGIPIVSGVDGKWVDKTQLLINKMNSILIILKVDINISHPENMTLQSA